MREDRPTNPSPAVSVLIVGLSRDVLVRVSAVLKPIGGQARMALLATLQEDAARFNPLIIFVDAYLYDFDPKAFEALATNANTALGVVNNANEAEELLKQLINLPESGEHHTAPQPKAAQGRQEFQTAKYDAKTIEEALVRMEAARNELATAKYDTNEIAKALENMESKRHENVTAEYDAATLRAILKRMDDS
jgi:hypothetical protein